MHANANAMQLATHREDYDLAVRMKDGDETALLTFTRKHQNFVYAWAKSRLDDHRDADDVTNRIFAELWTYLIPKWEDRGYFTSYFKKFASWHIGNEVKRLGVASVKRATVYIHDIPDIPSVLVETTTPEDLIIADAKGEAIKRAIESALVKVDVTNKQLKLHCWRLRMEGLRSCEVAKAVGVRRKQVTDFVCEINRKLRELLDYDVLMNEV